MKILLAGVYTCLCAALTAQTVTFNNNGTGGAGVGTPQTVPDPLGGAAGDISLLGAYCTAPLPAALLFQVSGLPQNYTHGAVQTETLVFLLNFGDAMLPGTLVAGGTFYIPLSPNPVQFTLAQATFSPTLTCTGSGAGVVGATQLGDILNLTSLIPGTFQGVSLSIQAVLLDSALSTVFTSNAVNFQL